MSTEEISIMNTTSTNSSQIVSYDKDIAITCLFEKIDLYDHSRVNSQILGVLVAVLTVCTVVSNSLVVAAMSTTKQYRRSPSHVLLLVLAVCDLAIGIISMPTYVAHRWMITHYNVIYDDRLCHISKFVKLTAYSFSSFTILTIALITIELYLAIVRPFVYEHRYNKQYFIVYLMLAWTMFVVTNVMLLYVFPADWMVFKSLVVSWLCIAVFILIIIFHSLLSVEVGKLNRSTTTNPCFSTTSSIVMPAPATTAIPASTSISTIKNTQNNNSNTNKNRLNRKAFRMTTSIITAFSLCYLPLSVVMLYDVFNKTTTIDSPSSQSDRLVRMYVLPWCEFIALCNSALDPVIYCFRLRFIRHKIRRMLCPARFQKVMDINMAVRNMRGDMGGGVEWASNGTPKYHPNTKVNHLFQRQAQTG